MNDNNLESTVLQPRPPIVVVLGHVDHGKTTLLDYIRATNVAQKEIGGITQSIGASVVTTKEAVPADRQGKRITFIDTPGHAAFANMRSRGAKVADIAILVISAVDSVKPQTIEALGFIREAQIPFIVAATKVDLPTASVDQVQQDLEKQQVLFEGKGGDIPIVAVSGKTGQGVDELLEMVYLVAELNEIKGSADENFEGVVIETSKGKSGPMASIVVRNGTLKVGNDILTESVDAKVRGIFDWTRKQIQEVHPGLPCQILGFGVLPMVGERVWKKGEKEVDIQKNFPKPITKLDVKKGQLPIIVKADNMGTLEAILAHIPESVAVLSSGVGDVTETDVFTAKAGNFTKAENAHIYVFESKVPKNVSKLADTEGVHIHTFNIIYELFEKLEEETKKTEEIVLGKAQIVAEFPYENKKVAGCKIIEGKIQKGSYAKLIRNEKALGEVQIISIRKGKNDIVEAKHGEECGIFFTPQLDFKIGDVILSVLKSRQ